MKKSAHRKTASIDLEHLSLLHAEAAEQLELMRTSLEAAGQASDAMRDNLDDISLNHWDAYLDVLHIICKHDEAMRCALKKYSQAGGAATAAAERQFGLNRTFILFLLPALLRRHRRIEHIAGLRGNPMSEYLNESLTMEREHLSHLVTMVQNVL